MIASCKKLPIFQYHRGAALAELVSKMTPLILKASDVLFRAGDQGSDMFVLQSGELGCINMGNEQVAILKAGRRPGSEFASATHGRVLT